MVRVELPGTVLSLIDGVWVENAAGSISFVFSL